MTDYDLTFSIWTRMGDTVVFATEEEMARFEWDKLEPVTILIGGEGCDVFEDLHWNCVRCPYSNVGAVCTKCGSGRPIAVIDLQEKLDEALYRLFRWIEETDAEVTIETRHPENVERMVPNQWHTAGYIVGVVPPNRGFPPNLTIIALSECEKCEGEGEEVFEVGMYECSTCNGSGTVRTEVGE